MLIAIYPTWKCNLNCSMCHLPKSKKEIPMKNFIKYFKENKTDVDFLVFTGGEPTLNKDFINSIVKLKSVINPKLTTICSNLTLKKESMEMIKRIKGENITISTSIDGNKKTHNFIRRDPFAFQKTIETIKIIRKKYPEIKLNITMTIGYENKNKILYVYSLARKLGTDFMINLICPLNFSKFSKEDKTNIIRDLKKVIKEENKRSNLFNTHASYVRGYFEEVIKIIKVGHDKSLCNAGKDYLTFGPDGSIYPCTFLMYEKYKIGDIYSTPLNKLKEKPPCNFCDYCFENCKYNGRLTKKKFLYSMLKNEFLKII